MASSLTETEMRMGMEALMRINQHFPIHERAEKRIGAKDSGGARKDFLDAAHILLGGPPAYEVPLLAGFNGGGVRWQPYIDMHGFVKAHLMGCYVGLASCAVVEYKAEEALAWLEEVRVLHINTRFAKDEPMFEWLRWHLNVVEMTYNRVHGLVTSSDLFKLLGNTGTAVDRRDNIAVHNVFESHKTPYLNELIPLDKLQQLLKLRHPDPSLTATLTIDFPSLQVYGSWKKLQVKKGPTVQARLAFSSFIYKGHLYVAGGAAETRGPWFRDLWRLDLAKLEAWEPLPAYPTSEGLTGPWFSFRMKVYKDKAYVFTGRPEIDFFDLVAQEWGSVKSTYKKTAADVKAGITAHWPYPVYNLQASTQQIVGQKLYVFGGTHGKSVLGCNLFMELDLETMAWRRLSGTVMPVADFECPGPRENASSWVDRDGSRIYLIFGEANRSGLPHSDPNYADPGYAYEDFWSWHIKTGKWRLERLRGNIPCPRSEAACVYNPNLDHTFVFGGYNPALSTITEHGRFPFTYYADTFMHCPSVPSPTGPTEPKWKHVLTRGFPTYRAQAQLLCDPDTGKMYLFGGYVNTDSVPSRKAYISRTFGDVWQLRVDMPGGCFEEVDLEDEAKTARLGPWQRCFTCGSAGRWKKCGGSCQGRAFFCDAECLKQGWKDHKKAHGCKKVAYSTR